MSKEMLLNKEELELRNTAPEECLRRLVARGALSLDTVTAALPPQVAEAVRVIAGGERVTPEGEIVRLQERDRGDTTAQTLKAPLPTGKAPVPAPDWARSFAAEYPELVHEFEAQPAVPDQVLKAPLPTGDAAVRPPEWARAFAATYPHVARLLEKGKLTPGEAVAAIRVLDSALGNYPTGARYAAP